VVRILDRTTAFGGEGLSQARIGLLAAAALARQAGDEESVGFSSKLYAAWSPSKNARTGT
jgi:hypothetical protein